MAVLLSAPANPGAAAWQNSGDATAVAGVLTVSPTAGDAQYQTISAALAVAVAGNTIYVNPGTYTENFTAAYESIDLYPVVGGWRTR